MIFYDASLRRVHARPSGADAGDVVVWRGAWYRSAGWRHKSGAGAERVYAAVAARPRRLSTTTTKESRG